MAKPQSGDEWLSPQELANRLGIALKTVYQMNSNGSGPRRYKIGGLVRYRWLDVAEWLELKEV